MSDRSLKDAASRLFGRGRYEAAAECYAALCERESHEPHWPMRQAEALRRVGEPERAIHAYRRAAELFLAQGHANRAVAVLRLAQGLAPSDAALADHVQRALERLRAWSPRTRTPSSAATTPLEPETVTTTPAAPEPLDDDVAPVEVEVQSPTEVRRLSRRAVAVRTATDRWLVIRSSSPLHLDEVCEADPEPTSTENEIPH